MCKISTDRAVQKVTRIKECGTQTATKKHNEAESVRSPSGCSEKPVHAKPACKQSKTESINSPAGCSEKPVSINVCSNKVKFNKMTNYLGSYATCQEKIHREKTVLEKHISSSSSTRKLLQQ